MSTPESFRDPTISPEQLTSLSLREVGKTIEVTDIYKLQQLYRRVGILMLHSWDPDRTTEEDQAALRYLELQKSEKAFFATVDELTPDNVQAYILPPHTPPVTRDLLKESEGPHSRISSSQPLITRTTIGLRGPLVLGSFTPWLQTTLWLHLPLYSKDYLPTVKKSNDRVILLTEPDKEIKNRLNRSPTSKSVRHRKFAS